MYKTCSLCTKYLSVDSFHRLKKGFLGRHSICKSCRKKNRIKKKKMINDIRTDINIKCNKCNEIKNCINYYINKYTSTGYQSYCKTCQKIIISNSMSKMENYAKIILKKLKKKQKKKTINITVSDILNKYNEQDGLCFITKHKMVNIVDIKQRTDNIWNMYIYILDDKLDVIENNNFQLVINLIYTMKYLYHSNNYQSIYTNLVSK